MTTKIHDFRKWATNHSGVEKFFFSCCDSIHEHDSRRSRDNALDKHILRSKVNT